MNRRQFLTAIAGGMAAAAITTKLALARIETVTDWLVDPRYPIGNVLRYGADKMGELDSAAAFERALEDAARHSVSVHFPEGDYALSGGFGHKTIPVSAAYCRFKLMGDFDGPVIISKDMHHCHFVPYADRANRSALVYL